MPVFQLILTSDTINEGREKINNAFSATTGLWSGSTGFQSLIHNNGTGNIALGDYAIAAGRGNTAVGVASFAGGNFTQAIGDYSYTQGDKTVAEGNSSFAGGKSIDGFVLAKGESSFAFCYKDTSTFSGVEGNYSAVLGGKNHFININSESSVIFGGENNAINNANNSSIVGGQNNTIENSQYNTILGGNNNNINSTIGNSAIIASAGASITSDSFGIILAGEGTISDNSVGGSIISSNGNITNNSIGCSIENSFGPPSDVCEINDSSFSKIIGRGFGFGTNNTITNSVNTGIYNSENSSILNTEKSVILGGQDNIIDSVLGNNIIVGGGGNSINSSGASMISASLSSDIKQISLISSIISSQICEVDNGSGIAISNSRAVKNTNTNDDNFCLIMGHNALSVSPFDNNKTIRLDAKNGRGSFLGGAFTESADYAEFFEWDDQNPSGDTRYGYFVSLVNGDKIEIGNDNLIGIVSVNPAICADSAEFRWKYLYKLDEWGNAINATYEHYKITGDTEISIFKDESGIYFTEAPNVANISGTIFSGSLENVVFIENIKAPILNERYDPSQTYIPREKRPEWSPIGLLGKLHVRTAETITGSTISANSDGMAINGSNYHVLKQIMDFNEDKGYGVVQILFK